MNAFTSQQRKLAYLVGILLLLIPIIYFGLPSGGKDRTGKEIPGGRLAELRKKHDLGESNLGNVDPSSLTMNLVLLGLRGIAVNQLWIQMDAAKNAKDWPRMREATESIVKLQPHYEKVWDFNGWNMAWNTSSEWDAVKDRYYWVKEGGKFMLEGVARNEKSTELRFRAATIFQKKIGIADEVKDFRKYFRVDPDPAFNGGPDPKFNCGPEGPHPDGQDNYIVGHDWYAAGVKNERDWNVAQHVTDRTTFHALPTRCLFDLAMTLQKEGQFGEITREAWADARDEWVNKFGREMLISPMILLPNKEKVMIKYFLEATPEDVDLLASTPEERRRVEKTIDDFQKIVNYRYWRTRGLSEAEPETALAHSTFYDAGEKYKAQNWRESLEDLEKAMKMFENVLAKFPDLRHEDSMVEECMLAVQMWLNIYKIEIGTDPPAEFPLRTLWQEQQHRMPNLTEEFQRRFLMQVGK